ncbi:MAG: hypothetical protein NTW69_06965 [Chloroflexi bacterium]|nr:hypothetical protein [Chloroflexota bacterium]
MKKVGLAAIVVLVAIGVLAMGMRRASMMNGGAGIELAAVSQNGEQILPSADVISVTGELSKGMAVQQSGEMIVLLSLNPCPR